MKCGLLPVLLLTVTLVEAYHLEKDTLALHVALSHSEELRGVEKRALLDQWVVEPKTVQDTTGPNAELGKNLKQALDGLLNKIMDAIDHGKAVKEQWLEKAKELRQKLKDLHVDIGAHAKDVLDKIKEKFRDYYNKILDKFGKRQ